MKWTKKPKVYPKDGDKKRITKFLWFPLKIGNETRWLEIASFEMQYVQATYASFGFWSYNCWIELPRV